MNKTKKQVLSLEEIYETDITLCLVMELVTGGELFYKIIDRGSYNERDAADVVRQLVSGVKYLHSVGICHRDLKVGKKNSKIRRLLPINQLKIFI